MTDLRESVARAMKYVVIVKPGQFPSDDTYCVVEGPDCIVQVGGDYADDHEANEACGKLNCDAAIAAVMEAVERAERDTSIPIEMLNEEEHIKMLTGDLTKRQMAMVIISGREKYARRCAMLTAFQKENSHAE